MIRGYLNAFPVVLRIECAFQFLKAAHYETAARINEVEPMGLIRNAMYYTAGILTIVAAGRMCGSDASGLEQRAAQTQQYIGQATASMDSLKDTYCPDNRDQSIESCVNSGIQNYLAENAK